MIISTKGRYGLKAMYHVAVSGEPVSIRQIAEFEDLSEQYLEQLFKKLKDAGLILSIRGAGGGYKLSGLPKDITVGDVLRALEGDFAPADCVLKNTDCENICDCNTRPVWQKIYDGINQVIDSYTLQDMLDENNGGTSL